MGTHKELVNGARESYERARRIAEERDPATALEASGRAKAELLTAYVNLRSATTLPRRKPLMAAMQLSLAKLALETEQPTEAETHLNACLITIKDNEQQPDFILIALVALNHLGILWSQREDVLESKKFLELAETAYSQFKSSDRKPLDIIDLFLDPDDVCEDKSMLAFEKTHTLTLYYLAQIYGSLENYLKSAVYCHITLERQLKYNDFEPIDWALNAATLSQFFMEKNGFKQARHHLSAATHIMDSYEQKLDTEEPGEIHDANIETYKHRMADVARCWVKYGLMLLSTSRDRLLHHADDDEDAIVCSLHSDLANLKLSESSSVSKEDLKQISFSTLNLSVYENQVTYKFLLTWDDAKEVFNFTKTYVDRATSYYTIETLASDHVQIMQDASQMYRYLAFFEDNDDRQAKMHKRRIDILEKAIEDLNPLYYMSFLRQIWYELGEINQEILNIKFEKLKASNDRPTPHALKKINHLAEESIKYYKKFLESMRQPATKEMPKTFTPETEKAAIGAYFQIGSLYNKIIVLDKDGQIKNCEETLNAYKALVDYCAVNENAAKNMKTEVDICREMVELLPYKIQKLKRELLNS